ncbi:MAG: prepilin-type N-terminal cleavage/methylation domain-containing protein [Candidatus Nealsonbacteria bacterium]
MKIQNYKKGFTLIEILIYIAVLTMIILAVLSFLIWAIKSHNKVGAMLEVSDSGYRVMEIITHEIRGAKSVYTPTSSITQLSLETLRSLSPGEETGYVDFYLCEGVTLCLKQESGDSIALTPDNIEVSRLEFIQIATSSVQIDLEINHKNPQNRPEYQASINLISTVSLRPN